MKTHLSVLLAFGLAAFGLYTHINSFIYASLILFILTAYNEFKCQK